MFTTDSLASHLGAGLLAFVASAAYLLGATAPFAFAVA